MNFFPSVFPLYLSMLSLTPSLCCFCGVFCHSLISTSFFSLSLFVCVCVSGSLWLCMTPQLCVSVCEADIWVYSIPHTSVSSDCLNPASLEFTQETTHIYTPHTHTHIRKTCNQKHTTFTHTHTQLAHMQKDRLRL